MKNIFTFLIALTATFVFGQTTSYPIYEGVFDGTTHVQSLTFPTAAAGHAGFANKNTEIYPLSFANGGEISFKASASAAANLKFRFEANPYPNVDPAYDTANIPITVAAGTYKVTIPSQGANTFNSAILFIAERDITVNISEVKIEIFDTDGTTVTSTHFPIYEGVFDGTTHVQSLTFPTAAAGHAGFANKNTEIYPLSFANGGEISFKASASAAANLKFRFEANPYPNVDPAYDTANIPITVAAGTYKVTIPSQGANTFNSAILYIAERDITVNISEVKITANAGTPSTNATLSDLQVGGVSIDGFSSSLINYVYRLTKGTTAAPQISATTSISGATTVITQASSIPGDATVVVTATDGTTTQTYTVSFIASLPNSAPPTPPTRNAVDVISIYGEAYGTAVGLTNVTWDNADFTEETTATNKVLKADLSSSTHFGADLGTKTDASAMTHFHVDYWIADAFTTGQTLDAKWSNHAGGNVETNAFSKTEALVAADVQTWKSIDVEISTLTNTARAELAQFIVTAAHSAGSASLIYIDNVYFYKGTPLGMDELDSSSFSTYPNPMGSQLTVEGISEVQHASIFDLTGREVLRATPNKAVFTLDTADLQHGVYMLSLQVGDNKITKKLMK